VYMSFNSTDTTPEAVECLECCTCMVLVFSINACDHKGPRVLVPSILEAWCICAQSAQ
jgi:hypothetical protein